MRIRGDTGQPPLRVQHNLTHTHTPRTQSHPPKTIRQFYVRDLMAIQSARDPSCAVQMPPGSLQLLI